MFKENSFFFSLLIAVSLLCLIPPQPAASEPGTINVYLNGEKLDFDQPPVIINSQILVPVRSIFETLEASVEWDVISGRVSITSGSNTVHFFVNSSHAYVNGIKTELYTPSMIIGGRTMVPLRFVSEALGADVNWDGQTRTVKIIYLSERMKAVLAGFDALCSPQTLDWLLSLYDPGTGLFYYSVSARDYEPFLPDLESTIQAFRMIREYVYGGDNLTEVLPAEIGQRLIPTVLAMRDPVDGYFYHPQWGKSVGHSRRERDKTWGEGLLSMFGANTLLWFPGDSTLSGGSKLMSAEGTDLPEYLQSEENYMAWLTGLPWDTNARSAGNAVDAAKNSIKAAGFENITREYLISIQNQETGLWGQGINDNSVGAAYKCLSFFSISRPVPLPDKIIESVICLSSTSPSNASSDVYNRYQVVDIAVKHHGENMPQTFRRRLNALTPEFLESVLSDCLRFKKSDNGFSYYHDRSLALNQGEIMSLGLAEGDVNSLSKCTTQARKVAYNLAGLAAEPPYENYRTYVADKLLNAPSIQKLLLPEIDYFQNFEDMGLGASPIGYVGAIATVAADPLNPSNKVMALSTVPGDTTSVICYPGGRVDCSEAVFECRLYVENGFTLNNLFNARIGDGSSHAYQWYIKGEEMSKFNIYSRQSPNNDGKVTIVQNLDAGTWHSLKIEYIPDGTDNTKIRFYINGAFVKETDKYYGGHEGREPVTKISSFAFTAFNSADATIFIDDIRLYVH